MKVSPPDAGDERISSTMSAPRGRRGAPQALQHIGRQVRGGKELKQVKPFLQDPVDNDNPFGPEKPRRDGENEPPEPEPQLDWMTGDASSDSFGLASFRSVKVPKGGVPQAKIHNVAKKSQKLPIVGNRLGRREPFERLKDIEDANVGPTIGMGARRQRSARRSSPSRRQRQRNRRRWMDDRWMDDG